LAQEAQVLVDSILQNYNQIKTFSDEHAPILKNAYSEAREAVFGSEKYDKKVTKLENDLKDLEKQFERINNLAELYINESILIYGKAAQHVKEAEKYDIFSLKYVDVSSKIIFIHITFRRIIKWNLPTLLKINYRNCATRSRNLKLRKRTTRTSSKKQKVKSVQL
jgi:hypothetical protein